MTSNNDFVSVSAVVYCCLLMYTLQWCMYNTCMFLQSNPKYFGLGTQSRIHKTKAIIQMR